MKTVMKNVIKVLVFAVIFAIIFAAVQSVLHYRWTDNEDIYTRNLDYANQPKDSIDVLYFGTSEIYAGVDPIVAYKSEGITGYNFAVTFESAVTNYYQLKYALKYQTPKVVVCDFSSLFDDNFPSDQEPLYRKIYETFPDKEIKQELLNDILKLDESQDYLSWKYPFFRYHTLWNSVSFNNFKPDYKYDKNYKLYKKGSLLNSATCSKRVYKITPDLWMPSGENKPLSKISVKYYDMFIDECQKRGISVVAVIPPRINSSKDFALNWETMKQYFDSHSVKYLVYNSYEQVVRMGLTFKDHYYDRGHMNTLGSIVFSKTLAADLKNMFEFKDRNGDGYIAEYWESPCNDFLTDIVKEQPDLDMCLSVIKELGMESLIYVNDGFILNYEDIYTALEKRKVDCEKLKSSKTAVINNTGEAGNMPVIIKNEANGNILLNYGGTEPITLKNNEVSDYGLYVFALTDNGIVNTIKFN